MYFTSTFHFLLHQTDAQIIAGGFKDPHRLRRDMKLLYQRVKHLRRLDQDGPFDLFAVACIDAEILVWSVAHTVIEPESENAREWLDYTVALISDLFQAQIVGTEPAQWNPYRGLRLPCPPVTFNLAGLTTYLDPVKGMGVQLGVQRASTLPKDTPICCYTGNVCDGDSSQITQADTHKITVRGSGRMFYFDGKSVRDTIISSGGLHSLSRLGLPGAGSILNADIQSPTARMRPVNLATHLKMILENHGASKSRASTIINNATGPGTPASSYFKRNESLPCKEPFVIVFVATQSLSAEAMRLKREGETRVPLEWNYRAVSPTDPAHPIAPDGPPAGLGSRRRTRQQTRAAQAFQGAGPSRGQEIILQEDSLASRGEETSSESISESASDDSSRDGNPELGSGGEVSSSDSCGTPHSESDSN